MKGENPPQSVQILLDLWGRAKRGIKEQQDVDKATKEEKDEN